MEEEKKRKEEIEFEAGSLTGFAANHGASVEWQEGYRKGVVDGAEWADRHPVLEIRGKILDGIREDLKEEFLRKLRSWLNNNAAVCYDQGYEDAVDSMCEFLNLNLLKYLQIDIPQGAISIPLTFKCKWDILKKDIMKFKVSKKQ